MSRLLVIITLLALAVVLLKRLLFGKRPRLEEDRANRVAKMIQCDYCEVYFPEPAAIKRGSGRYCCDEHCEAAGKNSDE